MYLARCYVPVKKYGEALVLLQRAHIYLRESRSVMSTITTDPIASEDPAFYPLLSGDLDQLDDELAADAFSFKNDWFAYNGGSLDADNKTYKKPLFFDVALNYVQLDMDRLQERAGKRKKVPKLATPAPVRAEPVIEKKPIPKAKLEEIQRAATPEPTAARGGLSSLLGGWWGRQ